MLGNHNIKDYTLDALNSYISFVLQKNTLFTGTIRENMLWGNNNATDEEIYGALKKAEILTLIESYKDKLDHEVLIDGKITAQGTHKDLIANSLLYQEIYNSQGGDYNEK